MIAGIQASRNFNDYSVFLRAMETLLTDMDKSDPDLFIYSAGPLQLNNMAIEFAHKSEDTLKSWGIKIQVRRINYKWFEDYMHEIDYFAYFANKGERASNLLDLANDVGIVPLFYNYSKNVK